MLRIRLFRTGSKKKPRYRIVVINRETRRDGRFLENVGHYNPCREPAEIVVNRERVDYWLKCGAQPSDTVRSLLKISARTQSILPTASELRTEPIDPAAGS